MMQMRIDPECIDSRDHAVLYGFSLFETFYINHCGSVLLFDMHIDRITDSMAYFGFCRDVPGFASAVAGHIAHNQLKDMVLRVTVTYGDPCRQIPPSILFSERPMPYSAADYVKGYALGQSAPKRPSASPVLMHKTSNRMENIIAEREARRKSCDDAIFLNSEGEITETCKSNLFFVKGGVIFTPAAECGLLPGITRAWVMRESVRTGIKCVEGHYNMDDLSNSDEIFITNSVMGVMPVTSICGTARASVEQGGITVALMREYRTAVRFARRKKS